MLAVLFVFIVMLVPQKVFAEVTGSGTEADPYVAGNATDLTTALANGKNSTSTVYVQLSSDITYTDSNQFTIYSNVVINGLKDNTVGSYYKMLKTGTSQTTATAGFYLNASGYDVTFRNLSFGDSTYSYYQTYYGILLGYSYQVDFTMENVDYYGSAGGQPLCNYNVGTTFTFAGTNNFNVQAGAYSQEFMEGCNVSFADDSNTTINHVSADGYGFIYNSTSNSTTTINIGANAVVNVNTNRTYFTFNNSTVNFTMADSAEFIYTCTAAGFNFSNSASTTSTYTVGNNATFAVSGAGKVGNLVAAKATFNATTPAEISFENTSSASGLFNGTSTLTTDSGYLFDYTVSGTTTTKDAAASSVSLQDSSFATGVTKVVYYPQTVLSYDAAGNVADASADANAISTLDVTNPSVSHSYTLSSAEYKVYTTSPLASDADITSTDSQTTITNSTTADYSGTTTTGVFSLSDVPAGTYTVFMRGTTTSSTGRITQTTDWVATTVTVAKSALYVTIPVNMTFAIVDNAEFTSAESYSTTNKSNYPVTFGIDSVTEASGVTLVEDVNNTTATNPLYLGLRSTADSSSEIPFITSASTKKTFLLSSFGGMVPFELVGQYGGSVSYTGITDLQYTLTVVIGS